MTELDALIFAALAFPAPVKSDLGGLLDLAKPQFDDISAYLVKLPKDDFIKAANQVHDAMSSETSPYREAFANFYDYSQKTKMALAISLSEQPSCERWQIDEYIDILSNTSKFRKLAKESLQERSLARETASLAATSEPMPELDALIFTATNYHAPVKGDRAALGALLNIVKPQFDAIAAYLVALPDDEFTKATNRLLDSMSSDSSPYSENVGGYRNFNQQTKIALAKALAEQPACVAWQKDEFVDIISGASQFKVDKKRSIGPR